MVDIAMGTRGANTIHIGRRNGDAARIPTERALGVVIRRPYVAEDVLGLVVLALVD